MCSYKSLTTRSHDGVEGWREGLYTATESLVTGYKLVGIDRVRWGNVPRRAASFV